MSKKVNITRDLESRRKIAHTLPLGKSAQKATYDATPESKAGTPTEKDLPQPAARSDKKSGRKTEGNP